MLRSRPLGPWAALGLLLLGLLPLASVFLAGQIAAWQGCTLHEGHANPCLIAGRDWGETLYTMTVLGWLMLIGLPVAAAGAWGLLRLGVIALWRRWHR